MSGRVISRKPVETNRLDLTTTNVGAAAWVQLVAATLQPCSAVEVFNGSNNALLIATGAAGSEAAIPYTVLPGGSSILLPWEIAKGSRIAVKSVSGTANLGLLVMNKFA